MQYCPVCDKVVPINVNTIILAHKLISSEFCQICGAFIASKIETDHDGDDAA